MSDPFDKETPRPAPRGDVLLERLVDSAKAARRRPFRQAGADQQTVAQDASEPPQPVQADQRAPADESFNGALVERHAYPTLVHAPDKQRFSQELVTGHEPFSAAAEAIRSIRSNIAATALAKGIRSMAVIGPHSGVGVTYLASNLAVGFAQMGIATLLVDANLRNPRAGELFGFPAGSDGLSELLCNRARVTAAVRSEVISNLSIIPAGALPPNPQELLASPEFLALTNAFHDRFGVVLYDTSDCAVFSDALVVASRVNAAILVARRHKTSYAQVSGLSKKLESLGCAVVGSVLNAY